MVTLCRRFLCGNITFTDRFEFCLVIAEADLINRQAGIIARACGEFLVTGFGILALRAVIHMALDIDRAIDAYVAILVDAQPLQHAAQTQAIETLFQLVMKPAPLHQVITDGIDEACDEVSHESS